MDPLPLVMVAPGSPARERFLASAPVDPVEIVETPGEFLAADRTGPGVLLLGPDLSADEVMQLLRGLRDTADPWVILLVEEEAGDLVARPLSLGTPYRLSEVAEKAGAPDEKGPLLELHWILRFVARARHDLNNPLTSGLAEVQLLLMDQHPPEVKESLETIQEQFRRLRDMVAELGRLRAVRRGHEG